MKISDKKKRIRYNKSRMPRTTKFCWKPNLVNVIYDIEVDKNDLVVQPRYAHIQNLPIYMSLHLPGDEIPMRVDSSNLPRVTSVPNPSRTVDWIDVYC